MRRRALLGLGGIALASGCLQLTEGSDEGTAVDYPEGLGPDGVTPTLVQTHHEVLAEQSFDLEFAFEDADGRTELSLRVGEERSLLREQWADWDGPQILYFDGDRQWWRQSHEGGVHYGRTQSQIGTAVRAEQQREAVRQELEALIRTGAYDRPLIEETDDGTRFRLSAEAVAEADALGTAPRWSGYVAEGADALLVADADGVVRSFEGTFETTADGDQRTLSVELGVGGIGATSVGDPDWLADARDGAPDLRASLDDDRRTLTVAHEGGDPVPAGASMLLEKDPQGDTDDHEGRLDEPLEEGEELHVWTTDGGIDWSIGDAERGTEQFRSEWLFRIHLEWAPYLWVGFDEQDGE